MATVPVSEFLRNFPTYQELVAQEPVEVTTAGEIAGVFISASDAAVLRHLRESRRAYFVSEIPDDVFQEILATEPDPETASLNHLMDDE